MMIQILCVALGGAVGSVTRYGVGRLALQQISSGFPWGTLAVNVIGSFLIGLCVHLLPKGSNLGFLIVTGFLGGFTTFSAFSIETLALLRSDQPVQGLIYVALSIILSLAAVAWGAQIKLSS
jgi:fluoride exporter